MTSFSISPYPPAADAHAPTPPSYWAPEHHVSTSPLRLNNWLTPPIQLLALSTRASALSLSLAQLRAILRYREDAKMFASVRDMDANRRALHASLLSPSTPPCYRPPRLPAAVTMFSVLRCEGALSLSKTLHSGTCTGRLRKWNGPLFPPNRCGCKSCWLWKRLSTRASQIWVALRL